jgi:hypothetical protein
MCNVYEYDDDCGDWEKRNKELRRRLKFEEPT